MARRRAAFGRAVARLGLLADQAGEVRQERELLAHEGTVDAVLAGDLGEQAAQLGGALHRRLGGGRGDELAEALERDGRGRQAEGGAGALEQAGAVADSSLPRRTISFWMSASRASTASVSRSRIAEPCASTSLRRWRAELICWSRWTSSSASRTVLTTASPCRSGGRGPDPDRWSVREVSVSCMVEAYGPSPSELLARPCS